MSKQADITLTRGDKVSSLLSLLSAVMGCFGLFVPRTICTLYCSYYGWTIRTLDDSYNGLFV